jgi:hydrogenase nickel incorporation protein HypA/HybF
MEFLLHELSIMTAILEIVLKSAEQNKAKRIKTINLKIGALSDIIPEWAQTFFDMISKDTPADGAALSIEKVPAVIQCSACGNQQNLDPAKWELRCAKCSTEDMAILSGREFFVDSIEIE